MRVISKATLEGLRHRYKPGTRVELLRMDDVQAPPIGTKGTVLAWTTSVPSWSHGTMAPACQSHMAQTFAGW